MGKFTSCRCVAGVVSLEEQAGEVCPVRAGTSKSIHSTSVKMEYWAGGISEMLKIAALASVYDLALIPHGHSTSATAQFIAAQPPTLCPILEYLIKRPVRQPIVFLAQTLGRGSGEVQAELPR
jgi:hypothetical protein